MRNFFAPLNKKTNFRDPPGKDQQANCTLYVAHYSQQIASAGRTTSLYINNDTNDPATAGSFYLLPDPYLEGTDSEENYLQDFCSDEEEMMLYDQPIITNHSLHKI